MYLEDEKDALDKKFQARQFFFSPLVFSPLNFCIPTRDFVMIIKIELTGIYEARQNSQIDLTNNLLIIDMKQCKKWVVAV